MKKKKKYNPLKKYDKGGKSTSGSIAAGMGTVKEEKSYFKPESFKKAESSESSNPLSKMMGKGKEEGKSKGGGEKGDTEGLLKALGAFSKGGKLKKYANGGQTDPPLQRSKSKATKATKTTKTRKDIPPTSMKKTITERPHTSMKRTITKRTNR